jgi:NAD(P)-dependent dehydrogenase (short-subunit alcohol dehydrogenase family)
MHKNRVVVVTGAAGGLGSLIAARFVANGDTVIAADTSDEELTALARRLDMPANLYTAAADVSDQASCSRLAEFATEKAQRVDVLVNCAGFFPTQEFDEMTLEQWNKVIGINLTGVFLMTKAMLPLMKGRGWGRIINIGSASAFEGVPGQIHYVAAKAGVIGFSRSLARAVGSGGITVNVVTPGLTLTPKARDTLPKELIDQQIQTRAVPRDEKGEDLVGAVFFLASPDSDFISGQTINVDGGRHML